MKHLNKGEGVMITLNAVCQLQSYFVLFSFVQNNATVTSSNMLMI